jgi:hypothetical protein
LLLQVDKLVEESTYSTATAPSPHPSSAPSFWVKGFPDRCSSKKLSLISSFALYSLHNPDFQSFRGYLDTTPTSWFDSLRARFHCTQHPFGFSNFRTKCLSLQQQPALGFTDCRAK